MARIPVFYSFCFDDDVMRVQQIRNMGVLDGDEPVSPNEWEQIKRNGAVRDWINQNMSYRRCVIVLIGERTASRPWVRYEIEKGWKDKRGLLGIYIHNLRCPRAGLGRQGLNPFEQIATGDGSKLSDHVPCYNPKPSEAYGDIKSNIEKWVNAALQPRVRFL